MRVISTRSNAALDLVHRGDEERRIECVHEGGERSRPELARADVLEGDGVRVRLAGEVASRRRFMVGCGVLGAGAVIGGGWWGLSNILSTDTWGDPLSLPEGQASRRAGDAFTLNFPGKFEMKFAWCPPGSFMRGGEDDASEKPVREIRLTKGFYAGIFEVTQDQWKTVMEPNTDPSRVSKGANLPVENVSRPLQPGGEGVVESGGRLAGGGQWAEQFGHQRPLVDGQRSELGE